MSNLRQWAPLRFLIVEDNPGDYLLVSSLLRDELGPVFIEQATSLLEASSKLNNQKNWSLVLLDLSLPDATGERLVRKLLDLSNGVPVVVLTGFSERDFGVSSVQWGVADYLSKDDLSGPLLRKSVLYSIERSKIVARLEEAVHRYELVAKATSDTVRDWNLASGAIVWTEGISSFYGHRLPMDQMDATWWMNLLHPDDRARVLAAFRKCIQDQSPYWIQEYRFQCSDGSYRYVTDRGYFVIDAQKRPVQMISSMQDITRQKEEEIRLRLLESVITNTTDSIVITEAEPIDLNGPRIVYVNQAFTEMTGYTLKEVLGKTPRILQGPSTDRKELDRLKEGLRAWKNSEIETINYKKDGTPFWVNFAVAPVADDTGYYTHWVSIQRDVTLRKVQEQEVLKLKNNYETLMNGIEDFIWSVSPEMTLIMANKSFYDYFRNGLGIPIAEGFNLLELEVSEKKKEEWRHYYQRAFQGESFTITQSDFYPHLNETRHVLCTLNPIPDDRGEIIGVACHSKDITEQRRMQDEINNFLIAKQQEITRAIIQTQEKERFEIGTELHDNVNQLLATSQLILGMARDNPMDAGSWIQKSHHYIGQAIAEIRQLSHRLAPSSFLKMPFPEAVEELLQTINTGNRFQTTLQVSGFDPSLVSGELQMNLYRIVQEQTNNIIKYAEASRIEVCLQVKEHFLKLKIADDGKGFDLDQLNGSKAGIGFSNMKNRVILFHGEFHVQSSPGQGCEVTALVPLQ